MTRLCITKNLFLGTVLYVSLMLPCLSLSSAMGGPSVDEPIFAQEIAAKIGSIYPLTVSGSDQLPAPEMIETLRAFGFLVTKGNPIPTNMHQKLQYVFDLYRRYSDECIKKNEGLKASIESIDAECRAYDDKGDELALRVRYLGLIKLAHLITDPAKKNPGLNAFLRTFIEPGDFGDLLLSDVSLHAEPLSKLVSRLFTYKYSGPDFWTLHPHYYHSLSKPAQKILKANLPLRPVLLMFPGKAKMGLTTITALLLEDVHCVGLPAFAAKPSSMTAHGILMSPLEFIAHDVIHFDIAHRKRYILLRDWSAKLALHLMREHKIPYNQAALISGKFTSERYQKIQMLGKHLLQSAASKFQGTKDRTEYNKVIISLFELFHEEDGITAEVLDTKTTHEALRALFENLKYEPVEAEDIFQTDPLTGKSSVEKEEREKIVDGLRPQGSLEDLTFGSLEERGVEENPFVQIVSGISREGRYYRFIQESLKFAMGTAVDQNKLLTLVGQSSVVPSLESMDPSSRRTAAISFINSVRERLFAVGQEVLTQSLVEIPDSPFESEDDPLLADLPMDARKEVLAYQFFS